ncbi:MAG: hypothetical protein LBC82_02275 [Oscillospiraceae bacterium]|jgi:hypothetical protein|nr:hypothetical protein [Oscillospiraceae bacterium]
MKKKIICFSMAALIFCCSTLSFTTAAHEIGTSGGYRWHDVMYFPTTNSRLVKVDIWADQSNLGANLWSAYQSATTHWNMNSSSKAHFNEWQSVLSADCVLGVPSAFSWEHVLQLSHDIVGIAYLYNLASGGICAVFPNPYGTPGGFNSGTVRRAYIAINPDSSLYNTAHRRDYLIRHEMGHVLGLGHPPDSTASIMHRLITSPWSTIQNHDRDDLIAFYP